MVLKKDLTCRLVSNVSVVEDRFDGEKTDAYIEVGAITERHYIKRSVCYWLNQSALDQFFVRNPSRQ